MEIFSVNVGWFSSGKKLSVIKLQTSYPAGGRSLWELSIRYPLRETSQRPFRNISKEMTFCDIFKTYQIHLKNDVFFVTSLRRLKNILKRCICVTSLRRLQRIWRKMSFPWRLWDISKTSLASICDFSKISHKNDFLLFP